MNERVHVPQQVGRKGTYLEGEEKRTVRRGGGSQGKECWLNCTVA